MILKILKLIQEKAIFIVILTVLNSTTAFSMLGDLNRPQWKIFFAQETVVVLCSMLLIVFVEYVNNFSRWMATILKWLVFTISGLLFIADIILLNKFRSFLDEAKLEIMLGADPYTIYEFFKMYVFPSSMIFAFTLLGLCLCWKKYKKTTPKRLSLILACILVILSLLGGVSLGVTTYRRGITGFIDKAGYRSLLFPRVAMDIKAAIDTIGNENEIKLFFDNSDEEILENNSDTPYVIFILGESADRNKMSAYGYKNSTTPILDAELRNKRAVAFTDVIAPANYTSRAMELIFTFAEKEDEKHWYENQNIIDVVKKAGYRTVWLSNQSPIGKYGNMDKILADRCDYYKFTSVEGGASGSLIRPYDEALLPLIDEARKEDTDKNFYVIHIEGSHEVFNMRYPEQFEKFHAEDEIGNNALWNKVKAEYDNTIYYTDYLIGEIIKRFENENAIIIYISDHGNEVYDGRNFVGHSSENERNKHMIEIPMVVYGTDKYWSTHPDMMMNLQSSIDRAYRTDNIIYFMEDVMGIKTTSYVPYKSILNDNYESMVRVYGGVKYSKE